MIKAEELRLGNLVEIDNGLLPETKGKPHVVIGIQNRSDKDFPDSDSVISLIPNERSWRNYSQWNEYIKPIPLTEEWLLKFGFFVSTRKNCYYKNWGTNGVELIVHDYHYKGGFEYELGSNKYKVVEYIHQLQNLYFALTGEELTINKQ